MVACTTASRTESSTLQKDSLSWDLRASRAEPGPCIAGNGGLTVALWLVVAAILLGPLWLAWNVLDFGPAIGLPELGFWVIASSGSFSARSGDVK
jgi:hypothetical protein